MYVKNSLSNRVKKVLTDELTDRWIDNVIPVSLLHIYAGHHYKKTIDKVK